MKQGWRWFGWGCGVYLLCPQLLGAMTNSVCSVLVTMPLNAVILHYSLTKVWPHTCTHTGTSPCLLHVLTPHATTLMECM